MKFSRAAIPAILASCVMSAAFAGEAEVKPKPLEERKRALEAIQKELEAVRPAGQATPEEAFTYLEIARESYSKFAKENPKTAEGFEAASTLAQILFANRHPDFSKYAQMAIDVAPAGGVDVKRLVQCWALIADGHLQKRDVAAARKTIENVKKLDKEIFAQMTQQLDKAEAQIREQDKAADGEKKQ